MVTGEISSNIVWPEADQYCDEEIARTIIGNLYTSVYGVLDKFGTPVLRHSSYETETDWIEDLVGPAWMVEAKLLGDKTSRRVKLITVHAHQGVNRLVDIDFTPDSVTLRIMGKPQSREMETLHELGKVDEFVTYVVDQMELMYNEPELTAVDGQ